jgi:two-component system sensor histidine kinase BaeS
MRRQVLWSVLAVAAVTLIAGLVAGAVINRRLAIESEAELTRQADATATLIAASLRENLSAGQDGAAATVARTLEVARAVGGHDYVEARLVGGSEVLRRFQNLFPVERPLLDSLGVDPEPNTVLKTEVGGQPVLAYVRSVPVTLRNDGVRLLIAIGRAEPILETNLLVRPLLLSLGIGALLAVILATWIAGHVGRRLDHLAVAAQAIAAGDFSMRAAEHGEDDVARVGAAFNEMAHRLEEGRRRERDFLMSVGHDLRTPMTTIRGYAEALDAGEIDVADLERVGKVLHNQTDRLSRLIEDLMMLARLEAREFTWRPEPVDLAAHLREAAEAQEARATGMRVSLVTRIEDVGDVSVDPDRVSQIAGNLIDNALRYTHEGGTVGIGLVGEDDWVALSVSDTGPGIDPEDVEHVFERLYVAQRYRPVRPEGSGLGLTIVKELVDAIGGQIEVESKVGRGTVVTVRLRRAHSG